MFLALGNLFYEAQTGHVFPLQKGIERKIAAMPVTKNILDELRTSAICLKFPTDGGFLRKRLFLVSNALD